MRILTRSQIKRVLAMPDAIAAVKRAFIELSTGTAQVPVRTHLALGRHDGVTLFMPGYLSEADALAVKVASVHNRNPERNLPRVNAVVLLLDPATGQPAAVMEGGWLTALRTGAASGVATELLARQDAEVAAVIGAGAQARTQLLAVAAVRPLKRGWIYARRRTQIDSLIAELQPQLGASIELRAADSPAQAVRESLIVCTATSSSTPVFDGADLQPGTHINSVGSFTPAMQEVDFTTLERAAKIVVDSHAAALAEAGDLIIALNQGVLQRSDIYGELGELAAGLKPTRENEQEITYFKSVGSAAQDAAIARIIYQHALREDWGAEVELLS